MTRPTKSSNRGRVSSRRISKAHPAILATGFVLGVLLHPFCIRMSEIFLSPTQEVVLLLSALTLTLLMFLLSKSHYLCSLLQAGGLLVNAGVFIIENVKDGWGSLLKNMDYEWWFRIILMWCGGVSVTILIRLLAHKKWDSARIRKTFSKGFLVSSIVFLILYIILLLDLFVFQREAFTGSTLNLIPFKGAFATYWPHIRKGHFQSGIFVQFFGNLLIFAPLGFFLCLFWRKHPHKWLMYLLPVILAFVIESCQYIFGMGQSDIDDLWMNVAGFLLGVLLAKILDAIRKKVTKGKEKTIFKIQKA